MESLASSMDTPDTFPFYVGKEKIVSWFSGFLTQKDSPFKSEIDDNLLHLMQGGIVDRMIRIYSSSE